MANIITPNRIMYEAGRLFTGAPLAWITAIGLAESGGDLDAISPVASDGSGTRGYGLFQIETEHISSQEFSAEVWQEPSWQVNMAWALSDKGADFNPWCTAIVPMNGVTTVGCSGAGSGEAGKFLLETYLLYIRDYSARR
jgi:Lysozyme like domain